MSDVDFKQALTDAGIPTNEAALKAAWEAEVVAQGSKDELESRGRVRHRLVLDGDAGWLRDLPQVRVEDVDGDTALFELLTPGSEHEILAEAMRRGNVREFAVVRPTLSEIYREVAA